MPFEPCEMHNAKTALRLSCLTAKDTSTIEGKTLQRTPLSEKLKVNGSSLE